MAEDKKPTEAQDEAVPAAQPEPTPEEVAHKALIRKTVRKHPDLLETIELAGGSVFVPGVGTITREDAEAALAEKKGGKK